jgi:signal transduction histidine kinase
MAAYDRMIHRSDASHPSDTPSYAHEVVARLNSLSNGRTWSAETINQHPDLALMLSAAIAVGEERERNLLVLAERKRELERILARLIHESGQPIGVLRGCCEHLRSECNSRGISFRHDYLADMHSWCNVIADLLQEATIELRSFGQISLNARRTSLQATVERAIASVAPSLDARGFSVASIRRQGLAPLVPLCVDTTLLQYSIGRLLRSAIDHSYPEPQAFHVELRAERADTAWHIHIVSYGRPVDPTMAFADGTPAGLGTARRLVEQHGGDLDLLRPALPTMFLLSLPRALETGPPVI